MRVRACVGAFEGACVGDVKAARAGAHAPVLSACVSAACGAVALRLPLVRGLPLVRPVAGSRGAACAGRRVGFTAGPGPHLRPSLESFRAWHEP